jgi:hypothetical protein
MQQKTTWRAKALFIIAGTLIAIDIALAILGLLVLQHPVSAQ